MKYLRFFLREQKKNILLVCGGFLIFGVVFFLGNVPVEITGYGFLLCIAFFCAMYALLYIRYYRSMEQLEQVLSNALKYTKTGKIEIFTEGSQLFIRDTGIGIRPEDLPRIFERGYTGYNGRADKKSTGIGLYLCKRVCDKLGHGIRVESEVGVGTTVCLSLDFANVDVSP